MSKYLNKLNVGLYICDKYEQKDEIITDIIGIKNVLHLNEHGKVSFQLLCDLNFIEYEIPKDGGILSFRFFIRTLGGNPPYLVPLLVSEVSLKQNNEGVMTYRFPISINISEFEFPRSGKYAIEIYKVLGKIDTEKENKNYNLYRKAENFISAVVVEIKNE